MLGINANTARTVYQRLEQEGLIDSRQGTGTFVASVAQEPSAVGQIAADAARQARRTGVDPREVAAALYVTAEPTSDATDAGKRAPPRAALPDRGTRANPLRDSIKPSRLDSRPEQTLETRWPSPAGRRGAGGRAHGAGPPHRCRRASAPDAHGQKKPERPQSRQAERRSASDADQPLAAPDQESGPTGPRAHVHALAPPPPDLHPRFALLQTFLLTRRCIPPCRPCGPPQRAPGRRWRWPRHSHRRGHRPWCWRTPWSTRVLRD